MSTLILIKLSLALGYAILPYTLISLLLFSKLFSDRTIYYRVFLSATAGTALFALISPLTCRFTLDAYKFIHPCLLTLAITAFALARSRQGTAPARPSFPAFAAALLGAALLVRLSPVLLTGDSLGGDDARFHNIIAQKILLTGRPAETWEPFAPVGVVYPQGVHVMTAFLAKTAGVPVHNAFNLLLVFSGVLTCGLIYLLGLVIFDSPVRARWAAVCYSFLPFMGSLDYFRWGGLPNSLGMLFLCLAVFFLLKTRDTTDWQLPIASVVVCMLAIVQVHHYTLVVAGIMFATAWFFSPDKSMKKAVFAAAFTATLACAPFFAVKALRMIHSLDQSSIALFRERPLTIIDIITGLNPAFVIIFALALAAARREKWNAPAILILSWLAGLLFAFVSLEYVYRGASLIITGGRDCYTSMTPSRMATDMAYPMALLCGFLPATALWNRYSRVILTGFAAIALTTSAASVKSQTGTGARKDIGDLTDWIQKNTPENSIIIASIPHLEYLAWRESNDPPLPASENRRSRLVTWKADLHSVQDWLTWGSDHRRQIYFIFQQGAPVPPNLQPEFGNAKYMVVGRRHLKIIMKR